ncbi:hypothetical protein DMUE_0086 [Dictyocoela muelleri]|nr:hypothetical protein DMUE_0086 [Dictyocoela muelleri]
MHKTIHQLNKIFKFQSDIDQKIQTLIKESKQTIKSITLKQKNQISTGTHNIQKNFNDLLKIKNNYYELNKNLKEIVDLQNKFSKFIGHFDTIKNISIAHYNFEKVVEIKRKIENCEKDDLFNKFNHDTHKNIDGNDSIKDKYNNNLWNKYLTYLQIDEFRLELEYFLDTVDRETYLSLCKVAENLNKLCLSMEKNILEISSNYHSDFLSKIDIIKKIIQNEENRDLISQNCIKQNKNWHEIEIAKINPFYTKRRIIDLKRKISNTIVQSIQYRFNEITNDNNFSIDSLEFVFSDLLSLEKIARKCGFLSFLFFEYHANLKIILDEKKRDLETCEILGVLEFVRRYKDVLEDIQSRSNENDNDDNYKNYNENENNKDDNYKNDRNYNYKDDDDYIVNINDYKNNLIIDDNCSRNNEDSQNLSEIISEVLNKPLIDKEKEYIEKYIFKISEKLTEWIESITNSEIEKFLIREMKPDEDENKKYISSGFINLLQIIKEQLEPINFDKNIFKLVTTKIIILAENFRNQINRAMEKDLKPSYQLKSKPGYEEYTIMVGNSGLKLAQYANSLPECQNIEVKALGNIFVDILKKSNQCLKIFILKTCQPITDQIFTDHWYFNDFNRNNNNRYENNNQINNNQINNNQINNNTSSLIKRFAVTIDDFLNDYYISMSEYSFLTFLFELSAEISSLYIYQISRKRAKIKITCRSCLERDFKMLSNIFKKYGDNEILKNLNLIRRIGPLVESKSLDLFLNDLKIFRIEFPDLKKDFVKNLIKKRVDLDDDEKRNWIDGVKKVFRGE